MVAKQKVRQSTIDRLNKQGMAANLAQAKTSKDPEFLEAVKRFYPGKVGAPTPSPVAKGASQSPFKPKGAVSPGMGNRQAAGSNPNQAAIKRRLELSRAGTNPDYKSTAGKASNTGSWLLRKVGDTLSQNNPKNANSNWKKLTGGATSSNSSSGPSKKQVAGDKRVATARRLQKIREGYKR